MLLAVVLIIWGIVGYKIYNALSDEVPDVKSEVSVTFNPKTSFAQKDTFSIKADYRDPFLGSLPKAKSTKRKVVVKKKVEPEIAINYTGSILDKDSKNSIFFVTIAGTQHLMKPGQSKSEVTLVSGTEKTIKIRINRKTRNIPLRQP